MAVIRWDPYRSLRNMERDLENLFNVFTTPSQGRTDEAVDWLPAADISEGKDGYHVELELPGVGKDDVKVSITNDLVTIRGEKKTEKDTTEGNYHVRERSYGTFSRSFRVPGAIDAENVKAEYKDGILRLALPKTETAKTRQIDIK